ncbi:MAG: bifunctional (p)ppGpp synthetase/guanosine-3',5'-bis(diphosphate) 3'-pyrophosphohydrolase, partial [Gammaproteobacteria bacterium]|nr:bifunctional (p)ppGpp synthetase/guanosine-3',5'-bis(diphosphate) 3'-pyrophosphohydrolase [Gammaproteobacteria bacterium]
LGYLTTSRARAKVRQWFKQQDRESNVAAGRDLLERELHRLGMAEVGFEKLAQRLGYDRVDDFLAAVGYGDVGAAQIAAAVAEEILPRREAEHRPAPVSDRAARPHPAEAVKIRGVGNLLTHTARCCKPVPPDPVTGYVTRGRGVTIHRADCPNLLRLGAAQRERLIEVEWTADAGRTYPVDVEVQAFERRGLLHDVTALLAGEKIHVSAINSQSVAPEHLLHLTLTLEIAGVDQLSRVLARIARLPNVVQARRRR